MAITGLFLCGFLVAHLSGNLLLLQRDGGATFTAYAEWMSSQWLIRVLELGLLLGFLIHIVDAALLRKLNRAAQPQRYAMTRPKGSARWAARSMGISGSLLFLFLIIHLRTFLVEHRMLGSDKSLYELVRVTFAHPAYVSVYVGAMVGLALHLLHGFSSAFRTLGVTRPRYVAILRVFGLLFVVLVPAGFAAIPLYVYFLG